jgi:hypothetical protein
VFKNPTIDFNALFSSLGNSTCSSFEVVLVFLLYEGSTILNASDQFVSCVYCFRFSSIPTDKNRICKRQLQTAVSPHPLKIGQCLYELIYSEYSILPPPKIFTIPSETLCISDRYYSCFRFPYIYCHGIFCNRGNHVWWVIFPKSGDNYCKY